MRAKVALALFGVLAIGFAGCAQMSVMPGAEMTEEGTVLFSAEGVSVIAKEGDPLSLLEAQMAAAIMAKANLLGKIKGTFITGTVEVDDLMYKSQDATATVEGLIARVTIAYAPPSQVSDSTMVKAIATLEINRRDLRRLDEFAQ